MIKPKKGEVFGMSFGMIFSIILIVFFVAAAFVGIRYFLNFQKNVQVNSMIGYLQEDIDSAWNSEETTNLVFNITLPAGINVDYFCFTDFLKEPKNANNVELGIYDNLKHSTYQTDKNLYFYVGEAPYTVKSFTIQHLTLENKNPVCFKIINKKTSIKIQKKATNALVEVYY